MRPINSVIKEIREETPLVKTFFFDASLYPKPGQYMMLWVRGIDEIPMSFSYPNGMTVQRVGDATSALFDLGPGSSIGVRGPLGNGFTLEGEQILLVGGGVGAAPLAFLGDVAKDKGVEVTTLVGYRCCDDVLFEERFRKMGDLVITTDDGSLGTCGRASSGLSCLDLEDYDQIYLCGPEVMMVDIIQRCKGFEDKIQASIERYMKCGMGVCGSCCLDPDGTRVCVEGPVIRADRLLNTEFGRYKRGPSGSKKYR